MAFKEADEDWYRRHRYITVAHSLLGEREPIEDEGVLVSFRDNEAVVSFSHQRTETAQGADFRRRYIQKRVSQRLGRQFPFEEVQVAPSIGEKYEVETTFVIKPDEPLYIGLYSIHEEEPAVLPKLIDDLNHFIETNELDEVQLGLVDRAIGGIKEIIEPPIQK